MSSASTGDTVAGSPVVLQGRENLRPSPGLDIATSHRGVLQIAGTDPRRAFGKVPSMWQACSLTVKTDLVYHQSCHLPPPLSR